MQRWLDYQQPAAKCWRAGASAAGTICLAIALASALPFFIVQHAYVVWITNKLIVLIRKPAVVEIPLSYFDNTATGRCNLVSIWHKKGRRR